jgi:hypothetical protein
MARIAAFNQDGNNFNGHFLPPALIIVWTLQPQQRLGKNPAVRNRQRSHPGDSLNYWLDLFTPYTWNRFRDHGATTSGFRPRQRKAAFERVKRGDLSSAHGSRRAPAACVSRGGTVHSPPHDRRDAVRDAVGSKLINVAGQAGRSASALSCPNLAPTAGAPLPARSRQARVPTMRWPR